MVASVARNSARLDGPIAVIFRKRDMNAVRNHPIRVFFCAVFILYALAACAVHVVPAGTLPTWFSVRHLHPTAAWLLLIAAVTLWIPAQGPSTSRWLLGLAG